MGCDLDATDSLQGRFGGEADRRRQEDPGHQGLRGLCLRLEVHHLRQKSHQLETVRLASEIFGVCACRRRLANHDLPDRRLDPGLLGHLGLVAVRRRRVVAAAAAACARTAAATSAPGLWLPPMQTWTARQLSGPRCKHLSGESMSSRLQHTLPPHLLSLAYEEAHDHELGSIVVCVWVLCVSCVVLASL